MPLRNTLPDVNPDEFLAMLDADTRDYLRAADQRRRQAGSRAAARDLREVFRLFEPTHRDLARVNGAVATRRGRAAPAGELAGPPQRRAGGQGGRAGAARGLGGHGVPLVRGRGPQHQPRGARAAARAAPDHRHARARWSAWPRCSGPASENLRPAARALGRSQVALRPLAREAEPLVRSRIRPLVRDARPLVRDLRPAASDLSRSTPDLERVVQGAQQLLQHGRVQPARARGPRRRGPRGGLPVLARLGQPPVGQPVLHRRRPRPVPSLAGVRQLPDPPQPRGSRPARAGVPA